uniref:Fibronectin type-III domain-containing protein n=1 Tax=Neogobius melanostomus TaxID=47308 RepID=A0A8C6WPQ3_9GOBI
MLYLMEEGLEGASLKKKSFANCNYISFPLAPCVPTNINGNLDCVSNAAWITWSVSDRASSYYVWAESAGVAHNSTCTSANSPCSLPDLKCGTLYNIRVTAQNAHCNSTPSATYQLTTGTFSVSWQCA